MTKEQSVAPEQTEVTPEVAPEQAAAPTSEAPTEEAPQMSKRDAFRQRISSQNPDLNMDDEDAYYDHMGKTMDEYEGYKKNSQRLRDSMSKSPAMAEMLLAAREQEDFDPVVWMVEQRGLDLEAAMSDPEYADKIAKARAEYQKRESNGKALIEDMKSNLPNTLAEQRSALEEAGLGEQYDDIVGRIFQLADDISHGKWDTQVGVLLAKGGQFDGAVNDAREAGVAEGLQTKVDDKLRKLSDQQEYVSGTQTPPTPATPKRENKNMFQA